MEREKFNLTIRCITGAYKKIALFLATRLTPSLLTDSSEVVSCAYDGIIINSNYRVALTDIFSYRHI